MLILINKKEFATKSGRIITMKALITIHNKQFVECYENNNRYQAEELTEVK